MSPNLDKSRWKRVRFGDVAVSSKEKVDPTDGSIDRYIAGEHMDTDDLRIHRWGDVSEKDLGPAFHRRFRTGQVLYGSRRTYLRKVSVADFGGVCANTTFVVETANSALLLQEFLPFVMSSEPFHAHAIAESKGSVNPYVNWPDIAKFEFSLPPLNEQKRIADLLWAFERHRHSLRANAEATSGSLIRFLDKRFSSTLGETVKIVDLCTTVVGGIWGSPEGENEVNALALGPRVYAAGATELSTEGSPVRSISRKQASSRLIEQGDIILERSGGSPDQPVGRVVIAGSDLPKCIPTDFQRLLRPNVEHVVPRYLFWKLRLDWLKGRTRDYSRRTTNIANLSVPEYLARDMVVPAKEDQMRLISEVRVFETALAAIGDETASAGGAQFAFRDALFGGDD